MNQEALSQVVAESTEGRGRAAAVRTAWVAGVFSAIVAIVLVLNAFRARSVDPLDTARIDEMSLQLNRTPTDEALRARLRRLDLQIRDRFVRSRGFAVDGLYLLLGGVAVCLAALEVASRLKKAIPTPNPSAPERTWSPGPANRRSVTTLGVVLAGFLATLSVASRHDSEAEYARAVARGGSAQSSSGSGSDSSGAQTPGIQPVGPLQGSSPGISGSIGPQQPTGTALTPGGTSFAPLPVNPGKPNATGPKTNPHPQTSGVQVVSLFPEAWGAAWPGFRGPGGVGIATTKSAPSTWGPAQNVIWKTAIPLPGWNSPVVWGDKVFVTGADKVARKVYCVNAASGAIVWAKDVPSSTKDLPQVQDDTGYAPSTAATDGKHVFAIFPNGDVVCFDFAGKELWHRDLGMPVNTYGHASSPVVYGNGLLVQLDQGSSYDDGKSVLMALNVDSGATVWQVKRPVGSSWTTPILIKVGNQDQLITAANPMAIAYNPLDGTEIWRAQCLSGDCAPSPTFGAGFVFTANMGATLTAIRPDMTGDVSKTGIAWTCQDDLPDIVSPLCAEGLLYMVTTEGVVTCLDAKTGKKQWDHNYNAGFHASPVFASGRIYVTENSGKTHVLAAGSTFKELGIASVGEDVRATPAFVGDRVYIRGKSNLFCIGAK